MTTLFFSAPAADKSVYGAGVQVDPEMEMYTLSIQKTDGRHII